MGAEMILLIFLNTFVWSVCLIKTVNQDLLDDWEQKAIIIVLWASLAGIAGSILYYLAYGLLS